jgi:hypothetical protein
MTSTSRSSQSRTTPCSARNRKVASTGAGYVDWDAGIDPPPPPPLFPSPPPPAIVNPHEKTGHFENSASSGGADCNALDAGNPAGNPPDDPDLVAILGAWPPLPDAIKAGILAMVKAAGGKSGGQATR